MELIYFAAVIAVACFVQAVAGFGLPMIATSVLVILLGIKTTVPLMAIVVLELQLLMVFRYRAALDPRTVWRVAVAAALSIPVGALFLARVAESVTVPAFGVILVGYALYSSIGLPTPRLRSRSWAFLFGALSGLGAGAYNMAGPPLIVYGDTQRWQPRLFKGNLQGCFLIITLMVILTHSLNGSITPEVLEKSLAAAPFVLLGALSGFYLDRFIDPARFRRIVLILLVLLGLNLVLNPWR